MFNGIDLYLKNVQFVLVSKNVCILRNREKSSSSWDIVPRYVPRKNYMTRKHFISMKVFIVTVTPAVTCGNKFVTIKLRNA